MRKPPNTLTLIVFSLILILLLVLIQIGVISIAMDRLGLSPQSVIWVLFGALFGSLINLPLFSVKSKVAHKNALPPVANIIYGQIKPQLGKTIIAINVGGALIPIFITVYLLKTYDIDFIKMMTATLLVTLVSFLFSRPVEKIGIGIPIFVAPVTAAIIAMLLESTYTAPFAYIAGTLGILLGADILRLSYVKQMGSPVASIGGAGTFDGIFLTGLIAVLLI